MLRFIALFALIGLCLSVAVHVAAVVGFDVQSAFPWVWLLHVGIFVVWFPAVLVIRRKEVGRPKGEYLKNFSRGVPLVARLILMSLTVYMLVNFALSVYRLRDGQPRSEEGRFVIESHGRVVEEVSEPQFHRLRADQARLFSGHWLFFYGVAFVILLCQGRGERPTLNRVPPLVNASDASG